MSTEKETASVPAPPLRGWQANTSSPLPSVHVEAEDLRKQQTAFCVLTLFVLDLLFFLHASFVSFLGQPSVKVLAALGLSFIARLGELTWLQWSKKPLSERAARVDGIASIVMLFALAALLALLTNHDHSPYQVLLAIPVLQSAFLFGLTATILTILAADATIFLWLWHYFAHHPPASQAEYLEGGMLAVIFALIGLLVWFLVEQLRSKQIRLTRTLGDLHAARESLVREEKLSAIGRLASGIAHEIRNPVAMIMSALSMASDPAIPPREREEMFAIANRQAGRLGSLATDFLTYARPVVPRRGPVLVGDLLAATEGAARALATSRGIAVECELGEDRSILVDSSQVEGALLNLALNAAEATPEAGTIRIAARIFEDRVEIDVENSGDAIPDEYLERIFEPFFTTKSTGTGLGLAIARAVANSHGGELWVSRNEAGRVTFTISLSVDGEREGEGGATHGPDTGRR